MLIIVEGISKVGKTALCNKLSERLNIPILIKERFGFVPQFESMYANFGSSRMLLNLLNTCSDINLILDGFHLSERVYGLLDRYYDCVDYYNKIDEKLAEMEDVILFHVNPINIVESSKQYGMDLEPYYIMFKKLFNNSKIKNKLECDYTTINKI